MTDRISLVVGDITALDVEAVVNAANSALQLGSGVAGAIRARGGPSIQRECDAIGHCPVGDAVATGAGDLPARWVIHAVGPHGTDNDAEALLGSACRAALGRAREIGAHSVAVPALSTGVFGFPMERAAAILVDAARSFAAEHPEPERILFCLRDREAHDAFARELGRTGKGIGRRDRRA
ncbi:MAG TPA: macro domain-containing protein [Thermoanaerobaculia bacterium]|jgi:O-acetyl-ADP-ribose deacetylase (regulator of RNase III)|nr:macro domain-containing protein [Thermoanaerobaculia bacterium]